MPEWAEAVAAGAGLAVLWIGAISAVVLICGANRACERREMRTAARVADGALTLGSASSPRIPRRVTNWEQRMDARRQELLYDATAPATTTNGAAATIRLGGSGDRRAA